MCEEILQAVKFDAHGLVVAIVQDFHSGDPLMVGYMNEEALRRTLIEKEMYYFSRSRQKIWHKGETSGHFQTVQEIRIDCDGDALLFKVEQKGGTCHMGYMSCFFRKLEGGSWKIVEEKVFDEKKTYGK